MTLGKRPMFNWVTQVFPDFSLTGMNIISVRVKRQNSIVSNVRARQWQHNNFILQYE